MAFLLTGDKDTFQKQKKSAIEAIKKLPVSSQRNKIAFIVQSYDKGSNQPLTFDKARVVQKLQKIANPSQDQPSIRQILDKSVEFFNIKNGGRQDVPKVLMAFVNDKVIDYDAGTIQRPLKKLVDQGIKVVLLPIDGGYSLDILPTNIKNNVDQVEGLDKDDDIKNILDKMLNSLMKGLLDFINFVSRCHIVCISFRENFLDKL